MQRGWRRTFILKLQTLGWLREKIKWSFHYRFYFVCNISHCWLYSSLSFTFFVLSAPAAFLSAPPSVLDLNYSLWSRRYLQAPGRRQTDGISVAERDWCNAHADIAQDNCWMDESVITEMAIKKQNKNKLCRQDQELEQQSYVCDSWEPSFISFTVSLMRTFRAAPPPRPKTIKKISGPPSVPVVSLTKRAGNYKEKTALNY